MINLKGCAKFLVHGEDEVKSILMLLNLREKAVWNSGAPLNDFRSRMIFVTLRRHPHSYFVIFYKRGKVTHVERTTRTSALVEISRETDSEFESINSAYDTKRTPHIV